MKNKKNNFPINGIILLAIILLAISLLIGYIWKELITSEFFAVKLVLVRNSDKPFDYLKGKNILSLDLNKESQKALLGCPDCRKVRFARIFPDCVLVDFLKRQPVALVKFYKIFAIDEHGVLFNPGDSEEYSGLPVIYGLETKIFAPKLGVKYQRPEMSLALSIINEFKANKVFEEFKLKRVDVADPPRAGFFMFLPRQGFEVRVGPTNIREKLLILGGLLMQARKEWNNIKYIDLRFKEPVIKLNNEIKNVK